MRTRTPPRSREQYILDSVPTIFRGGEWIEETSSNGGEGVSGWENGDTLPAEENYEQALYVTVVGGQKYDPDALHTALSLFIHRDRILVGAGRGVESDLAKNWEAKVIEPDSDFYGKNARKVNVEQVLCFAPDSPLLLVGDGTRVKQARAWLDRTKSKREVIELP